NWRSNRLSQNHQQQNRISTVKQAVEERADEDIDEFSAIGGDHPGEGGPEGDEPKQMKWDDAEGVGAEEFGGAGAVLQVEDGAEEEEEVEGPCEDEDEAGGDGPHVAVAHAGEPGGDEDNAEGGEGFHRDADEGDGADENSGGDD